MTLSQCIHGTLYHLCNIINHKNIPSNSKDNLHTCEDFLEVVGMGHIIAVALEILDSESMDPVTMTQEEKSEKYIHL